MKIANVGVLGRATKWPEQLRPTGARPGQLYVLKTAPILRYIGLADGRLMSLFTAAPEYKEFERELYEVTQP